MKNEVMRPAGIDSIVGGRNQSIELHMQLFDKFHELREAAAKVSVAGAVDLSMYRDQDELLRTLIGSPEHKHGVFDDETQRRIEMPAREYFQRLVTHYIDRRCWSHMLEVLGFESIMDRQAKQEFRDGLKRNPPAFTLDNCEATFSDLWSNRREIYLRGIANTFCKLDRRFRSHDGFKIGSRLIIERALNEWGSWNNYDRRDTLTDIERTFAELEGQPPIGAAGSIEDMASHAMKSKDLPCVVQGRYFRARVFKNGNIHLWFERKDLLQQVNLLLAEYYGEALGDGHNTTQAQSAPEYHSTPAKNFGYFPTPETLVEMIFDRHVYQKPTDRVLEPSAGCGRIARRAARCAAEVVCVEVQPNLAAGLRREGFRTYERDFLTMSPAETGLFDLVVMNPPFDRGRDCDHVRHAMQFVKPGGLLVAICAARVEFGEDPRTVALHRELAKWQKPSSSYGRDAVFRDLPEGAFRESGTNVNTCLITVRRPEER